MNKVDRVDWKYSVPIVTGTILYVYGLTYLIKWIILGVKWMLKMLNIYY